MDHHTSFDIPNNASHMQGLPVEILELVMIACAFPPPSVYFTSDYSRAPKWINITYVCRHWRQVALQCPHLWTHITNSLSASWVVALLDRSGTQALAVEIHGTLMAVPALESHLPAHISRVRHLRLDFYQISDHLERTAVSVLATPAPILESLIINNSTNLNLGEGLFAGYTPRLQQLCINHDLHVLPRFLLPNLTHLEIERASTIEEMIATLQWTPLLETLSLTLQDFPSSQTFDDIIHLPNLSNLELSGMEVYDGCAYFLQRVQLPPTVDIRVSLHNITNRNTGKVLSDMLGSCPPPKSNNSTPFTYLKIKIWRYQDPIFEGRLCSREGYESYEPQKTLWASNSTYLSWFGYHLRPPAQLDFHCISPCSDRLLPMVALRSIFDCMPLTDVHTLDLSVDLSPTVAGQDYKSKSRAQAWDPKEWLPILRLLPYVRTLKLSQDAIIGVLRALTPGKSDGSITPLWVCLSRLIIDSTFSDVLGKRQSSKAVPKTLAAFLAQRREVGLDNVACSVSPQAAISAPNARWCLRRVT